MSALFLEVVGDSHPPAELPRQGRLVIGASSERASFVVDGQGVAEVHCTIGRIKGGGWALKDLGSTFGTLVNGERVDTARLAAGDEILLGSKKLRVFAPIDEATAAAATPPKKGTPKQAPPEQAPKAAAAKAAAPKEAAPKPAKARVPAQRPESTDRVAGMPVIAGYRIERLLGRGAMGEVFLSTQESLARRVALKVLKKKLASDQVFVQRFRDEARAAARLNHPNIVTVYDVGEGGGRHFLSMEFMAGGSLEARLVELGPLPWREALDVVRDAAAGLVYAESRGIVHRDIKPENLMRNQDGVTKIADLGLAVQVDMEIVESASGKIFGTPHFIAPEIARGQPADARSDLYSLGVTAYRVLSGRTPFEGQTAREILRSALNDEPARLGTLVPGLPPTFEAVVHRLLEKDPEKRFPSASVLLTELERLRAGGTELSAPHQPRPKRTAGLAVVGIVLAAIAGIAILGGDDPGDEGGGTGYPGTGGGTETGGADPQPNGTGGTESNGGQTGSGTSQTGGPEEVDPGGDGGTNTNGGDDPAPSGVEADFEYRAERAYLALTDEVLTPAARAARLRTLAETFAGTDAATRALAEAEQLESGAVAANTVAAARAAAIEAAMTALRTAAALDASPFHPGQSLRAMNLLAAPEKLVNDDEFVAKRTALVDEVLKLGLARGQAAVQAADLAEADGDFAGTQSALRSFIGATDIPTAEDAPLLVGTTAPASLAEFRSLASQVRTRLDDLAGREGEFEAERLGREMTAVAQLLGSALENDLRAFDLAGAQKRTRDAAALVTDDALASELSVAADDLALAQAALDALVDGWAAPGWRRRSVLDPRPEASGSIDVVGVAPGSLMLGGGTTPTRVPLSAWAGRTRALENLFRGRLEREWTTAEKRGILALLTVTATLEALETLAPALQVDARRLQGDAASQALAPFDEALDWAEGDASLEAFAWRQRIATAALAKALVAREEGRWGLSAELLARLLDEQRGTWTVMLLSDGGQR